MRVPVYLVCAALVVAVKTNEDKPNYLGRLLEQTEPIPEQEPFRYLLPKLAAKYRMNSEWNSVPDPRFYLFPEMESNNIDSQMQNNHRNKRYEYRRSANPSLSIVAPIQTLRDAMSQARMRTQIQRNREFLQNLSSE